jgi:hypothetical protein
MTTELVILLTLFVIVIAGIFKTPTESFEKAGPKLGMRIEKHLETGAGFSLRTQGANNPISWRHK